MTILSAGTCTITADQAGDSRYLAAPKATQTFTIAPKAATVVLGGLSVLFNGSPKPATAVTTPAGLPVTITYNGSPTPPTARGTYAVVATISDANYLGSTSGNLVIR